LKTITSDISRVAMYESDAGKKKSTIAHIETVIDQVRVAKGRVLWSFLALVVRARGMMGMHMGYM
jgi:hypothetical protein